MRRGNFLSGGVSDWTRLSPCFTPNFTFPLGISLSILAIPPRQLRDFAFYFLCYDSKRAILFSLFPSPAVAESYSLLLRQNHICILLKLHFSVLQHLQRRQWDLGKMQQLKRLTGQFLRAPSIKSTGKRGFLVRKQFRHHKWWWFKPELILPWDWELKACSPWQLCYHWICPQCKGLDTGQRQTHPIWKFESSLRHHLGLSFNETKLKYEWLRPHSLRPRPGSSLWHQQGNQMLIDSDLLILVSCP